MKLKIVLVAIVILTGLFLSAFASPATPHAVKLQNTVVPPVITVVVPPVVPPVVTVVVTPAITLVPATLVSATSIVQITPAVVPVTGGADPTLWTVILFALLALLAIAFLVALFSPRNPPVV